MDDSHPFSCFLPLDDVALYIVVVFNILNGLESKKYDTL